MYEQLLHAFVLDHIEMNRISAIFPPSGTAEVRGENEEA
jgi:hypothetical protein